MTFWLKFIQNNMVGLGNQGRRSSSQDRSKRIKTRMSQVSCKDQELWTNAAQYGMGSYTTQLVASKDSTQRSAVPSPRLTPTLHVLAIYLAPQEQFHLSRHTPSHQRFGGQGYFFSFFNPQQVTIFSV